MRPIELYKFTYGPSNEYYTSYDTNIVYLGNTYKAIPIGRSKIELKNDVSKQSIDVTIDNSEYPPKNWFNGFVEDIVSLTIFQQTESGTNVIWKGRVVSISPEPSFIKITLESIFTSLRRPGLRARYQRNCRHVLYGPECRVTRTYHEIDVLATGIDVTGTIITLGYISTFPDGDFSAIAAPGDYFTGLLRFNDTYRTIIEQTSTTVKISKPIPLLSYTLSYTSTNVFLYRGCDKSRTRCQDRFGNLNNYGGFPFIPSKNPFDGSII